MLKIHISEIDIDVIRKIKAAMSSDSKIRHIPKTNRLVKGQVWNCSPTVVFQINSKYLINSLRNLGFYNNKTTSLYFPSISEELYLPFIRGYFDGDGGISSYTPNDGYMRYSCSVCGTESFLLFVKNYLEQKHNCKFNSKLYKRFDTENCCYTLTMSGKKNCIHFLNLLYKDSTIHLDRKYNKYLNITS